MFQLFLSKTANWQIIVSYTETITFLLRQAHWKLDRIVNECSLIEACELLDFPKNVASYFRLNR